MQVPRPTVAAHILEGRFRENQTSQLAWFVDHNQSVFVDRSQNLRAARRYQSFVVERLERIRAIIVVGQESPYFTPLNEGLNSDSTAFFPSLEPILSMIRHIGWLIVVHH